MTAIFVCAVGTLTCFAVALFNALKEIRRIDPADYERAASLCEMTEHGPGNNR